jgi:siroheme synthase (precorrin-2 oxidase/ferrochelatase)
MFSCTISVVGASGATPRESKLLARKIEVIIGKSTKELSAIRKRARQTILTKYDSRKCTKYMIDIIQSEKSP